MQRPRRHPAPPTIVCFVRHGMTPTTGKVLPGRARGLHLSEAGKQQAAAVASRFEGADVAAIYSSPLERARETAAPIADAVRKAVVVDRGLVECDFGEWTGGELAKLSKQPEWTTVQRWPSGWRFPGGESFLEMQLRIQETVLRYCKDHAGQLVVAVSHADPVKAAAALALGMPLDTFQRIAIGPCSTTAIAYSADGPTMLAVNSYGPIEGLPRGEGKPADKTASRRAAPRAQRR